MSTLYVARCTTCLAHLIEYRTFVFVTRKKYVFLMRTKLVVDNRFSVFTHEQIKMESSVIGSVTSGFTY